jgi:hypothetical protein
MPAGGIRVESARYTGSARVSTAMQKQIALIIPYFGVLPTYFLHFVESVSHSPNIDVLLFTDARIEHAVPGNFKVYPYTLSEFNRLASRALSIQVSARHPFKVNDFKPTYGILFHEYIRDYEFWACGDIDVVHGDLAHFLAPLMRDNDIVSCRKGWFSGSLCMLRNRTEVNSAYTCSASWQKCLTSPEYECFEELGGRFFGEILKGADLRRVSQLNGNIDTFTHVIKRLAQNGSLRCAFEDLACEHLSWGETLVYDGGKLTRSRDGSEVMYFHYVTMKRRFFEVPYTTTVPRRFYIRKTGIYTDRPGPRIICQQEGPRVFRGALSGFRRLPGRCFKTASHWSLRTS